MEITMEFSAEEMREMAKKAFTNKMLVPPDYVIDSYAYYGGVKVTCKPAPEPPAKESDTGGNPEPIGEDNAN